MRTQIDLRLPTLHQKRKLFFFQVPENPSVSHGIIALLCIYFLLYYQFRDSISRKNSFKTTALRSVGYHSLVFYEVLNKNVIYIKSLDCWCRLVPSALVPGRLQDLLNVAVDHTNPCHEYITCKVMTLRILLC